MRRASQRPGRRIVSFNTTAAAENWVKIFTQAPSRILPQPWSHRGHQRPPRITTPRIAAARCAVTTLKSYGETPRASVALRLAALRIHRSQARFGTSLSATTRLPAMSVARSRTEILVRNHCAPRPPRVVYSSRRDFKPSSRSTARRTDAGETCARASPRRRLAL